MAWVSCFYKSIPSLLEQSNQTLSRRCLRNTMRKAERNTVKNTLFFYKSFPSLLEQSNQTLPRRDWNAPLQQPPAQCTKKDHYYFLHQKNIVICFSFLVSMTHFVTRPSCNKYPYSYLANKNIYNLFFNMYYKTLRLKNGIIDFEFCVFYNCDYSVQLSIC